MSSLYDTTYNPDVLSCIANLSNDEVFTPPEIANAMLDMLPQELFESPDTTFLEPACKSGVFLREIAKRLLIGLEDKIPDLQERVDHIFQKQLYGIAITELTSLLSRRSLYCSKYPNSVYSITKFDDIQGNIRFKNIKHTFLNGKCVYCGASESEYGKEKRGEELESHAYEFIHTLKPEEIWNMKFDVIIGNPPYQLSTTEGSAQATPLYNKFVEQAKKLNPRYLSMIIPARWFAGGMGLDKFRSNMLNDGHITNLVDYANSKDCFSGVSISGGVCYFLWSRDENRDCEFTNIINNESFTLTRPLNEFNVLVRYNKAISILHKIQAKDNKYISDITSAISPFGIPTKVQGEEKYSSRNCISLYGSKGVSYISNEDILKNKELLSCYKVLVSQTSAEHAGEPSKDGMFRVLTSSMKPIGINEACTHSYILIGEFKTELESINCYEYLKTKFVRFLILQALSSIHLSKSTFCFVPQQDFTKSWTDEELYDKYGLTDEEIEFIESMIKPMELD